MKYVWLICNASLVILSAVGGYSSMSPRELQHVNPDITYCSLILLIMPIFAVGSVLYSLRTGKCKMLHRPSWDRNPMNWWYDPLQSLFITNFVCAGLVIGSAFRLSRANTTGFWLFVSYCCMTSSLFIGQFLVYRIFQNHIVKI